LRPRGPVPIPAGGASSPVAHGQEEQLLTTAYVNRIATAVPEYDVHTTFVRFARTLLDQRRAKLFDRMADRAQISHRWSSLKPAVEPEGPSIDEAALFTRGQFPSTAERMRLYEAAAPALAERAVMGLGLDAEARRRITHVIVTTCTGLSAPGLDLELVERCGLNPSVERTVVGFMGCYAGINALKLSRHIVRSEPSARVLLLSLELCTLHLQETDDLEQVLSFLVFGDGAAASLVTAEPTGIALDRFHAVLVPETTNLITWHIRELGFDMFLSGQVPAAVGHGLKLVSDEILEGRKPEDIDLWAVHPGGRSVLDAVEGALALGQGALSTSRDVLDRFGNMSSATVMFVLKEMLEPYHPKGQGCAMAFGPGLTAETMLFRTV
jgi:predicted naringenin-chalcone synthase